MALNPVKQLLSTCRPANTFVFLRLEEVLSLIFSLEEPARGEGNLTCTDLSRADRGVGAFLAKWFLNPIFVRAANREAGLRMILLALRDCAGEPVSGCSLCSLVACLEGFEASLLCLLDERGANPGDSVEALSKGSRASLILRMILVTRYSDRNVIGSIISMHPLLCGS